jgi:uncharacterized OB-fold protein
LARADEPGGGGQTARQSIKQTPEFKENIRDFFVALPMVAAEAKDLLGGVTMSDAVAEGVFVETDAGPRLIAGRRKVDGEMRFPMPKGPEALLYDPVQLSGEGRLWSFTVQRFRPKTPPYIGDDDETSFRPFAVGYVEFPGQVIVEGRIRTEDFSALSIGQSMRVELASFATSTRGAVTTYAFSPAP